VGAHGDPFVQALGADVAGEHAVAAIDPEGVTEAIPTGLGPTAVRVPPEVVEAAEVAEAPGASPEPAEPEPEPDDDRHDDRDPRPAG
jgi:hypothetical protein